MMPWYAPLFLSIVLRSQTSAICDDYAQQREQTSGVGGKTDGKTSRKASKLKDGKSGYSSVSKSIKSKVRKIDFTDCLSFVHPLLQEIITDSEREDGPNLSAPQRKAEPGMKLDNHKEVRDVGGIIPSTRSLSVQEKHARSSSKIKSPRADPKASKDISPSAKAAPSGSKRKLLPEPLVQVCHCDVLHFRFIEYLKQSDSDAENHNTTPKVSSSSRRITDNQVHDHYFSGPLEMLIVFPCRRVTQNCRHW
jgi:hypothetical protein